MGRPSLIITLPVMVPARASPEQSMLQREQARTSSRNRRFTLICLLGHSLIQGSRNYEVDLFYQVDFWFHVPPSCLTGGALFFPNCRTWHPTKSGLPVFRADDGAAVDVLPATFLSGSHASPLLSRKFAGPSLKQFVCMSFGRPELCA